MLVQRIQSGTVIDHIPVQLGLVVLRLLGEPQKIGARVALVINATSTKMGKKDILKIEGVELRAPETQKLALVAPQATVNIIRDYKVAEKITVVPPERVSGVLVCPSSTCISTRRGEPIQGEFILKSRKPLVYTCVYCGSRISQSHIVAQLGGSQV